MAEIVSLTRLPWTDGSSILGSPVRVVWADGTALYSNGGTYTAPSPPAGGTPAVPNLTARTAIAAANSYNLVSTCTVIDLRDGQPVPVDSVSFNTDEDALFWALSLTGDQSLYDKLKAGVQPATVAVTLNGEEWRFVIKDVPRERRHGSVDVRATGYSLTCLAGAPYEFEQNWSLDGDTTALQLAAAANVNTGLTVEWGLIDWPIPDGVFSHTGTPLSVVKRVADAVGAMIQSDPKDFTVRVVPRYDLLPNEWPTVAPDAQLAEAALESEGYENTNKPAYDGVYVLGQQGGAAAFVRLAGTSGANLKPMVTDALLTDLVACQQRGMAELGRSGEQQRHTLTLPVYSGTGEPNVLRVGKIIKVMEPTPWWGMVRSVAVQAQFGEASQTVTVERHTRLVDGTTYDPNAPTPVQFVGTIPAQTMTAGASFLLDLSAYVTDGVPPYSFSMRSGTLPAWLNLDGPTGHVTGTVPGSMTPTNLQFRVTDSVSSTDDSNSITFSISAASGTVELIAASSTTGGTAALASAPAGPWTNGSASVGGAVAKLVASPTVAMFRSTSGLRRSGDGGNTWTVMGAFTSSTSFDEFTDPLWDGAAWLVFDFGASLRYRSTDGGLTWTTTSFTAGTPADLAYGFGPATSGSTILAISTSSTTGDSNVYRSTDGGLTWTEIVVVSGGTPAPLWAMHVTGSTWVTLSLDEVLRSTDDGLTWSSVGTNFSYAACPRATNGTVVLVLGQLSGSTGAYRSANGGLTWSAIVFPSPHSADDIVYDAANAKFVTIDSTGATVLTSSTGSTGSWTVETGPGGSRNRIASGQ